MESRGKYISFKKKAFASHLCMLNIQASLCISDVETLRYDAPKRKAMEGKKNLTHHLAILGLGLEIQHIFATRG